MPRGETATENGGSRAFAAFISYSHADTAAAARLQRRLERYRLPKNFARTGKSNSREIGRIFRDREDLAAAPSLSEAIKDALSLSQALIVVCSPDARVSRWVNEEISLFRTIHPDRPILAALVRGEPSDSFPEALSEGGREPLAADLRKDADGWSLGFLKIVAGIARVPLDTLIQRDAQRRVRRVTWITLGAISAMLVMGIMTFFAISARNEAARQRASAEGLVEYMLTDLRDKLRGVGRIDVMGDVNHRAMQHYRSQGDLSDLPADSLERRARILHAMGEDEERSSQLQPALAKFREAHRTTAALLAREPRNPDRIFAHAQSEFYVGLVAWRQLDRATTTRHWQGYLEQAEALARIEPDSLRSEVELGYALGNLCDLNFRDKYDLELAEKFCALSVKHFEIAAKQAPDELKTFQDLANRHGWLAMVELARGKFDEAAMSRNREAALLDKILASDPQNIEFIFRRSWPDKGLGEIAAARKNPIEALLHYGDAHKRVDQARARVGNRTDLVDMKLRLELLTIEQLIAHKRNYADNLASANRFAAILEERDSSYFIAKPELKKLFVRFNQ